MTDEQNKPVRSREEQAFALAQAIGGGHTPRPTLVKFAHEELVEAEARGAAEQRRKDAESEYPSAYRWTYGIGGKWRFAEKMPTATSATRKPKFVSPLYTRPANVAALEDRVRELEEENAKLKTAQFYGRDEEEGGSNDISSFFDDHEPGTILEIDGYRCVNTKWVLWDGNTPHVFDTEDEATAALTREGGV